MRKAAGYLAILMSFGLILLATAGASPAWATRNSPEHSGGTLGTLTGGTSCSLTGNDVITWHSEISGAVQGGTASVSFTVAEQCTVTVSLVSYEAPSALFDEETASQQTVFAHVTVTFTGGTHTLTVAVPSCFFQIDFVRGEIIEHLGPAGSNNFYDAQGRLIAEVTGGDHSCTTSTSGTTSTSTSTSGGTTTSTSTSSSGGTSTSGTTGSTGTSTTTGTSTGTSTSTTGSTSTSTTGGSSGSTSSSSSSGTSTTTGTSTSTSGTTGGSTSTSAGSTTGTSTSTTTSTSAGSTSSTSTSGGSTTGGTTGSVIPAGPITWAPGFGPNGVVASVQTSPPPTAVLGALPSTSTGSDTGGIVIGILWMLGLTLLGGAVLSKSKSKT